MTYATCNVDMQMDSDQQNSTEAMNSTIFDVCREFSECHDSHEVVDNNVE